MIFACSGAADVGAIADRAARKMTREGTGTMFCMAGIGGRIDGIMNKTASAGTILAIDGCPLNCVKHSLEKAGFTAFKHFELSEIGLEKGKSPVTADNIEKAAAKGSEIMTGRTPS